MAMAEVVPEVKPPEWHLCIRPTIFASKTIYAPKPRHPTPQAARLPF
jgi:hypothetical protein